MNNPQQPQGTSYSGPAGALNNSPWLASSDIIGMPDQVCEIEDVIRYKAVTFDGGRKQENVGALKFKGKKKQLLLTAAANRKTLQRMFTADTAQWRGKQIRIFVDMNVKQVAGGTGPGLRIRSE